MLFPPLATLLLVWLLLPQGAVAEEDDYTLPDKDPCHVTLEGYKRFFGQRIDNYFLLTAYRKHVANLEQWQRCCPGGEKTATKFRPKNADEPLPGSWLDIEGPAVFAKDAPCKSEIYSGKGDAWRWRYKDDRSSYWEAQYENIAKNLHACCLKHFNKCLEGAFKHDTSDAGRQRIEAETTRCLERFSPDYVVKVKTPSDEPPPQPTKKEEEEAARTRQAAACTSDLARVQKEYDEYKRQADQMKQANLNTNARLTGELNATRQESAQRVLSAEAALAKAAPVPGHELLEGFPTREGSFALVIYTAVVATVGYFFGYPGRSWDSRVDAGGASAVIAVIVFSFSVAFLPDTRFVNLLLAVMIAVLVVAVRALVRSQIEVRHRAQTPPTP